jgi:hypothetical protein
LRIGRLDELELHVVVVLLGRGSRLFDNPSREHIELTLPRRLAADDADLAHQVLYQR